MRTLLFVIGSFISTLCLHAQSEIGLKLGGNINSATINGLTESLTPQVNTYTGMSVGVYFSTCFMLHV